MLLEIWPVHGLEQNQPAGVELLADQRRPGALEPIAKRLEADPRPLGQGLNDVEHSAAELHGVGQFVTLGNTSVQQF